MDIQIINTGYFYADGGAMFGAIPKTAWSRRYPSDETNGCVLAMRSLLVSNVPEKVILIDNGAGTKHLRQLSYYNFFDLVDLGEELHKRGISPGLVTDVVLTHLHFDHCGYSTLKNEETGEIYPAFPNAIYWVSRKQWDNFLHSRQRATAPHRYRHGTLSGHRPASLRRTYAGTDRSLYPYSRTNFRLCRRCDSPGSQCFTGVDFGLRYLPGHFLSGKSPHAGRSRQGRSSPYLLS